MAWSKTPCQLKHDVPVTDSPGNHWLSDWLIRRVTRHRVLTQTFVIRTTCNYYDLSRVGVPNVIGSRIPGKQSSSVVISSASFRTSAATARPVARRYRRATGVSWPSGCACQSTPLHKTLACSRRSIPSLPHSWQWRSGSAALHAAAHGW